MDFSEELDNGYSHMRDDDPQSINDDFVRTFTVATAPPAEPSRVSEPELEIVARRHGPATALLARWNLRAPLELPVLGFGGAEEFRMPLGSSSGGGHGKATSIFVAGGVGITPLLAQAAAVLEGSSAGRGGRGDLRLLWSLRGEDLALAIYVLEKIGGLGSVAKLFVTGGDPGQNERAMVSPIQRLGAEVVERRMSADDVLAAGEEGRRKFYCCTGPQMMKAVLQWTEGEDVVFESFEY
ncbi:hypothetical protein GGR56DRAFT_638301 [Xylariaceae sp. FL0804]|nr:hypothetical protein GGR56DRAFT_638301 [Xylariaceae sp. FL0804]